MSKITITVSGRAGSGKSAMCGEIEILCKALGLKVEWTGGQQEKNLTHADWTEALEMYKPEVTIIERIERAPSAVALDDQTNALEACRAIVKWCDENQPAGDALWCVQLARRAVAAQAGQAGETTYVSSQATNCAQCGEHKHTPLRIDWMGGYVCLTCIDKELESRESAVVLDDGRPALPEEVREALTHAIGGWRGAACGTRDDAEGERRSVDYNRRAQVIENWLARAASPQVTATHDTTDYEALEREHLGDADKRTGIYVQPTQTKLALTDEHLSDLQEAREILENMVRSVELDGNYSTEATCTFLRQALLCLPAAQPESGVDRAD